MPLSSSGVFQRFMVANLAFQADDTPLSQLGQQFALKYHLSFLSSLHLVIHALWMPILLNLADIIAQLSPCCLHEIMLSCFFSLFLLQS